MEWHNSSITKLFRFSSRFGMNYNKDGSTTWATFTFQHGTSELAKRRLHHRPYIMFGMIHSQTVDVTNSITAPDEILKRRIKMLM